MQGTRAGRLQYKWLVMISIGLGTFMSTLDTTIVNVSLPTITRSFHSDLARTEWVITAYLVVISGLLLTVGRLSDMVGRRRLYAIGFGVFVVASLLCGSAANGEQLIGFRVLQAIGAALLMANAPAILTEAFPSRERGKALGLMGMVVATGTTVGPIVGGLIVATIGWRWIFWINAPVGVVGTAMAVLVLRDLSPARRHRFDHVGAGLLFVALVSLLLALNESGTHSRSGPLVLGALLVFALSFIAFVLVERRQAEPVVPFSLFRARLFSASNVVAVVANICLFALIFLMPFYLENVLHKEPRQVGMLLAVMPLTGSVVTPVAGWLSDRIGSRGLTTAGMVCIAASLLLLSRLGLGGGQATIALGMGIFGVGFGLFQSPNTSSAMGSVPRSMLSLASGTLATGRNVGMVMGAAVTSAIFRSRLHAYAQDSGKLSFDQLLGNPGAVVHAFHVAYWVVACICVLGILAALVRGPHQRAQAVAHDPQRVEQAVEEA